MKKRSYQYSLCFISLVILVAMGIQGYWNYKSYHVEKRQFINEVQAAFNNAIDDYYIELGKKNTIGFFSDNKNTGLSAIFIKVDSLEEKLSNFNDIDPSSIKEINVVKGKAAVEEYKKTRAPIPLRDTTSGNWSNIISSLIISIHLDSIQLDLLNQHIDHYLATKELKVDYGYVFKSENDSTQIFRPEIVEKATLSATATSAYLPKHSTLKMYFNNTVFSILKRNFLGLVLSTFLLGSIIICLFWLLRIIRQQKQLAALKNDLISNITHEFKTPISTISVALEGMQHFNPTQDLEKNKNYLHTSSTQLKKLSLMVEKLLETATLDSNELQLNKEEIEINQLLETTLNKHQVLAPQKTFYLHLPATPTTIWADVFHLENAFNNLLDNAIKYGGNEISVSLKTKKEYLEIIVEDNGKTLTQEQAKHLFEKFYRVPKGNRHDVKGFGIGLYYTQKIIEKHDGNIALILKNSTRFVLQLPYE